MAADDVVSRLARLMSGGGRAQEHSSIAAEVDALLAAHEDLVYAICLRFLGDPETARQLAQSVLLTAYIELAEFRGQEAFTPWLYSIARDQSLSALALSQPSSRPDPILELVDQQASVLRALRRQDRIALLHSAASVLEPLEQEAVHLYYIEGVPRSRVTGILGIDPSCEPALLDGCRERLGRELRSQLDELSQGLKLDGKGGQ